MFEIIKVVFPEPIIIFLIPASIAKVVDVIRNGAKKFFADGTAAFTNAPADLLNKEPKDPLDPQIFQL